MNKHIRLMMNSKCCGISSRVIKFYAHSNRAYATICRSCLREFVSLKENPNQFIEENIL